MEPIKNRLDFVFIFDVKDGNPNGDPDAGNLPRIDPENGMGLVTDVCLKRKVRNYIQAVTEGIPGFDIFVREKAILNNEIDKAYEDPSVKDIPAKNKADKVEAARQFMCRNYYDIRTFGAVLSVGKNAGQVRGPIQMTFARSVEPVCVMENTITRMAVTTEKDSEKQEGGNRSMGRKFTVPYGVYVAHGFISANLAAQTGFSDKDLSLFLEALENMFDLDRSAARGLMSARKLVLFRHDSKLGSAPANILFDRVKVERTTSGPARSFDDYKVVVDKESLPEGVTVEELI